MVFGLFKADYMGTFIVFSLKLDDGICRFSVFIGNDVILCIMKGIFR